MDRPDYLDFDLLIEPGDPGYQIRVLHSPAGQIRETASASLGDPAWPRLAQRLAHTHDRGLQEAELADRGRDLFALAFPGQVTQLYYRSLDRARDRDAGLRIRLRLADAPELLAVPWEILYDPQRGRFLALSDDTPLVRYLELPIPETPLAVSPPLRVLAVAANPTDLPPLDVEREKALLAQALDHPAARDRVQVTWASAANLMALQDHLRREPVHIFHFIGHGLFDPDRRQGMLAFQAEDGRAQLVTADQLAVLLHDRPHLRLVVLNSCDTGRTDLQDPFSGLAQHLVAQGIPGCVAMQVTMPDRAAIAFSRTLYAALADGTSLDTALVEARKAVYFAGYPTAWAIPVLYTHAPDGRIFAPRTATESVAPEEGHPGGVHIDIASGGGTISGSTISIGDVAGRDIIRGPADDESAEDGP